MVLGDKPTAEQAAYHATPRHQPPLVSFIALFGGIKPVPSALRCRAAVSRFVSTPNDANGNTRAMGTPRNYTTIASAPKVA